ncbi:MAG: sigma-54 dependent transcriptional regulator [Kiritimatiellia bacterium]
MSRILLVDDEPSILSVLSTLLKAEGYEVTPVNNPSKAAELLVSDTYDLMITDIRMTPINGMHLLKLAHEQKPTMSVLIMTAFGSVDTAVEALKIGAFDYVTKPFKVDELLITVQRALDYHRTMEENVDLKTQLGAKYKFENIVSESEPMRRVCEMIERVAPTDTTVLITGESGTGKELVAKAIHAYSRRKGKKFLAVNCAALPETLLESEMFGYVKGAFTGAAANKEGLFEAATGGTIFLDEIGSMPLSLQAKFLRVLQEKEVRRVGGNENIPVDVRVLAATNIPLEELISKTQFREDLYYRLSVINIAIKPIRERVEDILPLIHHVLLRECGDTRPIPVITPEARQVLERYTWPGNVRELENAIKHALTFALEDKITCDLLPSRIVAATPMGPETSGALLNLTQFRGKSLKAFLREKEKEYLQYVLSQTSGDKEKAARELKISLATLYRKLPEPQ